MVNFVLFLFVLSDKICFSNNYAAKNYAKLKNFSIYLLEKTFYLNFNQISFLRNKERIF